MNNIYLIAPQSIAKWKIMFFFNASERLLKKISLYFKLTIVLTIYSQLKKKETNDGLYFLMIGIISIFS